MLRSISIRTLSSSLGESPAMEPRDDPGVDAWADPGVEP